MRPKNYSQLWSKDDKNLALIKAEIQQNIKLDIPHNSKPIIQIHGWKGLGDLTWHYGNSPDHDTRSYQEAVNKYLTWLAIVQTASVGLL